METWYCKGCDTSVGEDELECPVCDAPRYGRRYSARPRTQVRKGPSVETLQDLAKFVRDGKFSPEPGT